MKKMNERFVFLLFLVTLNGISAEVPEKDPKDLGDLFDCLIDGLFNGKFPYKGNCNKFWNCTNGVASEENCPSGFHFSHNREECLPPSEALCDFDGTSKEPTTETDTEGSTTSESNFYCWNGDGCYEIKDNCRLYYNCSNGIAVLEACRGEMVYSHKLQKCIKAIDAIIEGIICLLPTIPPLPTWSTEDPNKLTTTTASSTTSEPVCLSASGKYPHVNCWQYWQCENWIATLKSCPLGHKWDNSTSQCVLNMTCSVPLWDKSICKNAGAYYQDRNDCRYFYQCDHSYRALRKQCAHGLYFDEKDSKCDYAHIVYCYDGSNRLD